MRKFFAFLFVFLLIAAGLGYLLYPTISDQIGQAEDGRVMKAYREKTAAMSSEQISNMLADADARFQQDCRGHPGIIRTG